MIIMETKRLFIREMDNNDYLDLREILQDKDVMYAWEHSFSDKETKEWLEKQLERYKTNGYGLWALIEKTSYKFIGQCGFTIKNVKNKELLVLAYLLNKKYWKKGFATEAAKACINYAHDQLNVKTLYTIIRTNNIQSQKVAERLCMKIEDEFIVNYFNMEMPHYLYKIEKGKS